MNTDLMFSSEGDFWRTPAALLAWPGLARFGFTLDAAANDGAVCGRFITAEQDALKTPWDGRVWCNPPYSMGKQFVRRALDQSMNNPACEGICLLVPARTDTGWWQEAWPHWNLVLLLAGRLTFWMTPDELAVVNAARAAKGRKPLAATTGAPFPSALLIRGFGLTGHVVQCVAWKPKRERKSKKKAA